MSEPIGPLLPYLGTAAFGGNQRLFLYVKPSRDNRFAIEEWCTRAPCASVSADWRTAPADHIQTRYEDKRLGDTEPVFLLFERRVAAAA